jgi:hypothetical protein
MIDPKLLKEIMRAAVDAQLGYGTVNHATYARHVTALLREREEWVSKVEGLVGKLAAAEVALVKAEASEMDVNDPRHPDHGD